MTEFHVDAAQVATASSQAATSAANLRTEVAAMMGHLTALENTWHGTAAASFAGVLQEWRAAQVQVDAALDNITTALGQAAQQYQAAEDNASRLFSH